MLLPDDIHNAPKLNKVISRRPSPDQQAIESAVELIEQAKRPLLMIASGANRKRISKGLARLVEKSNIPFFDTRKVVADAFGVGACRWLHGHSKAL